jgi:hypothetical protein
MIEDSDIKCVMKQTIYSYETSKQLLIENKGDIMLVIQKYLIGDTPIQKNTKKQTNINQEMFKQFRTIIPEKNI